MSKPENQSSCGSSQLLSRVEAQSLVDGVTVSVQQYRAVPKSEVDRLLRDRAVLLHSDPIRKLGPCPGFVYPWNVVDYLSQENPRKSARYRPSSPSSMNRQ
jgi:hypothetical protein